MNVRMEPGLIESLPYDVRALLDLLVRHDQHARGALHESRDERSEPVTDEDVVRRRSVDGDGRDVGHDGTNTTSTSSATSSGDRSSVTTTWVATCSYSGRRSASIRVSSARGLIASSGRLRFRPTRSTAAASPT